MFRNRFLGGVSFRPFYAPDDGSGAAGGGGGGSSGTGGGQRSDAGGAAAGGAGAANGGVSGGSGDSSGAGAGAAGAANGGGAAGNAGAAGGAAGGVSGGAGSGAIAGGAGDAGAAAAAAAAAAAQQGGFPADWRQKLAGEDKQALKTLERFTSPQAFWQSYDQLRLKMASGELKAVTPKPDEGAKPEELAAWRKDQGLPESAENYVKEMKLSDGLVLADTDKPLVENFAKVALDNGISQDSFNRVVDWYYQTQDALLGQRQDNDATFHDSSLTELSQEWGPDTKRFQRSIANLMERAPGGLGPEGIGSLILMSRTPDGKLLGDHPGFNRWAVQMAQELNPESTVVPPGTPNAAAAIDTEMQKIAAVRARAYQGDSEAHRQYYGHNGVPGLDVRERELIDAQIKMKARAA